MTFMTRSTNPLIQPRFFEPFFGRFNFLEDEAKSGTWAPAVDVAEEKDKILVRVEVPGHDYQVATRVGYYAPRH